MAEIYIIYKIISIINNEGNSFDFPVVSTRQLIFDNWVLMTVRYSELLLYKLQCNVMTLPPIMLGVLSVICIFPLFNFRLRGLSLDIEIYYGPEPCLSLEDCHSRHGC